jgi:hypothetical protein
MTALRELPSSLYRCLSSFRGGISPYHNLFGCRYASAFHFGPPIASYRPDRTRLDRILVAIPPTRVEIISQAWVSNTVA